MASIKRLKKDIDYLTFAVVADCLNYSINSGKNKEQITGIVEEVITSRNQLRNRINSGRNVEQKERKAHFKAIFNDLLKGVDGAFSKLSDTVKQA